MTDEKINKLVDRFLSWPLPKSVCSDDCVTDGRCPYQRVGTNLLTADEAKQMLEYLLSEEGYYLHSDDNYYWTPEAWKEYKELKASKK